MVAKDSPLLIDSPKNQYNGYSSAHSDLDAAVAKLRMTAYMWQAMTAEDLRSKGVGRRTFRLEEEWAADTVSRDFLNARHDCTLAKEGAMRATAKVHIIRSSKTTAELRDADVAQQNPSGQKRDALFDYFLDTLKEAGGCFSSSGRPIVAGLILDSHYSVPQKLILGHAALGCHNPNGISLGMFGSHLTYSWPRFIEEVIKCLQDCTHTGDSVGNDNGQCNTMQGACSVGQGAFLHEVGHAFGSPHGPGIMERGYEPDWPRNFTPLVGKSTNNAEWNLRDALLFRQLPHFRLPADLPLAPKVQSAVPKLEAGEAGFGGDEKCWSMLKICCDAGIAQIRFQGISEKTPTSVRPANQISFTEEDLESRFDRSKPLKATVLGMNGKECHVRNVWRLFKSKPYYCIQGTTIRLTKRSICCDMLGRSSREEEILEWAQLLKEKGPDGKIYRAVSIDLRVGCVWDGGVVEYEDGHKSHWGPMKSDGQTHEFGGHASEKIHLPPNATIERIQVNRGQDNSYNMVGVRMRLSNGKTKGELNKESNEQISKLAPGPDEVIVGFFGKSDNSGFGGVMEFGIITVPKDIGLDGLPDAVFDMPELRNTCEMNSRGYDQVCD
ncbi:metallopeptidase [Delitschia confertaspora ATCC 74209]|uniref:Metallopeptidase n=1 Tax=Delitschia confertaspora ATCC 74209 TaxID=1513339 RepID=A0A9P4JI27_9PLEO|nr:metallopeptidase [Delitschia confertaspora ATCC 74209]